MSQALEIHNAELPAAEIMTPMAMIARALTLNPTPETLTKLMELQERWEANQARKAFDEAMSAFRGEIEPIRKNRQVGFDSRKPGAARTDYRHEDLAEVARTVDPILHKHGLSYRFRTSSKIGEPVSVTCIVSHRLGHSEENTLESGRDDSGNKNSIQAVGSAITYLQRYSLKAALGLSASNDDDGKASEAPQDAERISAQQVAKVLKLIEETGSDIQKFCAYLKIAAVPEITVGEVYNRALDLLEAKRNAK